MRVFRQKFLIGFVATYDVASSAQARFLSGLLHHHTPRINTALLVLEPEDNRPLSGAVGGVSRPLIAAIAYPCARSWADEQR